MTSFCQTSVQLNPRQLCDLELILNGGFMPLDGFLGKDDYESVLSSMRLKNGTLWPIPIVLDVSEKTANSLSVGEVIRLEQHPSQPIAYLEVTDIWQPDKLQEAQCVYGTTNPDYFGVNYVLNNTGSYYIGGKIVGTTDLENPFSHYDFTHYRRNPAQLKAHFKQLGVEKVVAFQTRNPMHRAHYELTKRASEFLAAHLLIHPVVGATKTGDVEYATRVKCYKEILPYYSETDVTLSLLPIAMRMAGPREALWHAIIRKNYGCTHFIIGRDHAGPGADSNGKNCYAPYESQELVQKYADEIGIAIIPFQEMVYVLEDDTYYPANEVPEGKKVLAISGTQFRRMLKEGSEIPEWFSFPSVIEQLKKHYPPSLKQGFTLFFTGLSGAGKSTIAQAVAARLAEIQDREITILDGDEIRTHLSQELDFSKEHRSINVRRAGFVAKEITKNGGIAICAMIAPYKQDRIYNRNIINGVGKFIEIYVSTPLELCKERDVKGLYEKAAAGIIPNFTGISDPYEVPDNPELMIDASSKTVKECLEIIIAYLKQSGYIKDENYFF